MKESIFSKDNLAGRSPSVTQWTKNAFGERGRNISIDDLCLGIEVARDQVNHKYGRDLVRPVVELQTLGVTQAFSAGSLQALLMEYRNAPAQWNHILDQSFKPGPINRVERRKQRHG